MSDSMKKGILRLRHLQEVTEAKGEEMAEQKPRFSRLAREDSAPRVISAFNLFQTPEPLARRIAELLSRPLGRVLEPSAGLGRLFRAVRGVDPCCHVTLVDSSPECCGELYRMTEGDESSSLHQGDFLAMSPDSLGLFDSILMNPPFQRGDDARHIMHALKFLRPGGSLVSLCAGQSRSRKVLAERSDTWIDLPSGSFRSEGTGVEVSICIFLGK